MANPAPAAAASQWRVTRIATASTNAAIICSRNSQPMVGIDL